MKKKPSETPQMVYSMMINTKLVIKDAFLIVIVILRFDLKSNYSGFQIQVWKNMLDLRQQCGSWFVVSHSLTFLSLGRETSFKVDMLVKFFAKKKKRLLTTH